MKKARLHHWPLDFLFIFIITFVDQWSKWWAFEEILEAGQGLNFIEWIIHTPEYYEEYLRAYEVILPFLNIVMVWNPGISFGLLGETESISMIISIVSAIIIVALSIWMIRTDNRALAGGLSMVIGGAIGNLIDRIRFGAVGDFIDFHVFGWHWPAFNLADTCIVLGIGFALFDSLFLEPQRRSSDRYGRRRPPQL
jgi:signal peptidase II